MQLNVSLEYRFYLTPDGRAWTDVAFAYPFWTRYLEVFDCVQVVARAAVTERPKPDWQPVGGENVSFVPLPYYVGPAQLARRYLQFQQSCRRASRHDGAFLFRVPSWIAMNLCKRVRAARRPYGLEVVGDPQDVFAPGAVQHPLRPALRALFTHTLRKQCAGACAVGYVTSEWLQRRYPAGPGAFTTHYSSIELPEHLLVSAPRQLPTNPRPLRIVTVGSLEQLYKGPDVLLRAAHRCVQQGLDVQVVYVGDGKYRSHLERMAGELGMQSRVQFRGRLPAGERVRQELDVADLFVLASRTEGLPRAMIEAMARALPCVGSHVGGVPELLAPQDMVAPDDDQALAALIRRVLGSSAIYQQMSERNLARARDYTEPVLQRRRVQLYRELRDRTACHPLATNPSPWARARAN